MNARIRSYCTICDSVAAVDGRTLFKAGPVTDPAVFLTALYRHTGADYRKFFKMDRLSKLGFLAAELLLNGTCRDVPKEDMAVILWNGSASLDADKTYWQTIARPDEYFPSPADFVYTLPNIVTGEIAIRSKIFGETSFYISREFCAAEIFDRVADSLSGDMRSALCGWVDFLDGRYEAVMMLVEEDSAEGCPFDPATIDRIYNSNR